MAKFKVGDTVRGKKSASKKYSVTTEGYEGVISQVKGKMITINGYEVLSKHFKIIKKVKSMKKTKTTKSKAIYKIGDKVYNNEEGQRSTVLAVNYDTENEIYVYTLKCLDDGGSIHAVDEDDVSIPEVKKMTLKEIQEYYYDNEGEELIIVK